MQIYLWQNLITMKTGSLHCEQFLMKNLITMKTGKI